MSPHQLLHGGNKNRLAPVAKPPGIDPQDLLQERENRYCVLLYTMCLELIPYLFGAHSPTYLSGPT